MASQVKTQVQAFIAACQAHGFRWSISCGSTVVITKNFAPGDNAAYTDCDMVSGSILALAPLRGGSVWGTDGASVGGYVGLKNGEFVMNKSGEGKRFIAALKAA